MYAVFVLLVSIGVFCYVFTLDVDSVLFSIFFELFKLFFPWN